MKRLTQLRGSFDVGDLHVYAGHQLIPAQKFVAPHAHEQDHLMVMMHQPLTTCPHCAGALPQPEYRVTAAAEGKTAIRTLGPFGIAYVPAGVQHSVEQLTPDVVGGFACIFPRRGKDGLLMADPKREAEPGVQYIDG